MLVRRLLHVGGKATYSAYSEVPDDVTSCILECQLTALFTSITTASDTERLESRQAPKIRVRLRLHVESTALFTVPDPPFLRVEKVQL